MMKKNSKGNIIGIAALVLLAAILVYFFIRLNQMEKMTLKIQEATVTDSGTISSVVNFLNTNVNAQQ